ncbi:MAG: D-TA family PLP-dependent enzyme [Flavobacteriaceae bacterium]
MSNPKWYELDDASEIITPSLLVFPDRIENNIREMIAMVADVKLLRPHIKTHKTAEIIKMHMAHGIQKFKCATIAEAELLAMCGAPDILLAMQPVGANIDRFFKLINTYPNCQFSALVDNSLIADAIGEKAKEHNNVVGLWMDINNGMNRTGIQPNGLAEALYLKLANHAHIEVKGLHVYDGHLRNTDFESRKNDCDEAFEAVLELKNTIDAHGIKIENIIAGGSPSFPIHAKRQGVVASPGTVALWDAGYGRLFPEMKFVPAAVLITRIISKPARNILCLDLGHKSIAPEMPFPRVQFLGMEGVEQVGQSEEHLVLKCANWDNYKVGDVCYAVPVHICPTVAKYESLQVVSERKISGTWKVAARNQKITV